SNPKGVLGTSMGNPIPLAQATGTRIEIKADLNGDGVIAAGGEEDVIYEYIDDPLSPDGTADQIRRQAGDQLVIENVRAFVLEYQLASGFWTSSPTDTTLIRKVSMKMTV